MSKPIIITFIVCLGIPFLMSFKSSRSRTYRRRAMAIGLCVMCVVVPLLPSDEIVLGQREEYGNSEDTYVEQGQEWQREPATCYPLSEVDLTPYAEVGCADVAATNWLIVNGGEYPARNAFDGNANTCWQDGVDGNGEGTELTAVLSESCELKYIVIYNGQTVSEETFRNNGRVCQLEIGNGQFTEVVELPDENTPFVIKLDGWNDVSTVTFKINSVYPGSVYADTCITEIWFLK